MAVDRNSMSDRDILIRTMLGEAASEGPEGMGAVAHVIQNRMRDDRWGNTIRDVALQPEQFSAWNSGAGGNSIPMTTQASSEEYRAAGRVADQVLQGQMPDPTGGATHYYSPQGMEALVSQGVQDNYVPNWLEEEAARSGGTTRIGGHVFAGRTSGGQDLGLLSMDGSNGGGIISTQGSRTGQPIPSGTIGGSTGRTAANGFMPQEAPSLSVPQMPQEGPSVLDQIFGEDNMSWMTPKRSDALLAIGTGLLSGDSWAEGGAAAGKNLMGVNAQHDQQRQRQQGLQMDVANKNANLEMQQRRINQGALDSQRAHERAQQSSQTGGEYGRPFNVVGRDPDTGQEIVKSARYVDGEGYMIQTDDGEWVNAETVMNDVRVGSRGDSQNVTEGAGGIPNADFISEDGAPTFTFQRDSERSTYNYASRAINAEKDLSAMIDHYGPEAFTSITDGLQRWSAKNSENKISAAVLRDIVKDSGIQGQASVAMSRYLQSILRSDTGAAYTGTEINDYATTYLPRVGDTPEDVAYKRKSRMQELYSIAGGAGSASPYLQGAIAGQYELPGERWTPPEEDSEGGILDSSNSDGQQNSGNLSQEDQEYVDSVLAD